MVVDFSSYYNLHIIAFCIQPKYLKFQGIRNVYNNGCAFRVNVILVKMEKEEKKNANAKWKHCLGTKMAYTEHQMTFDTIQNIFKNNERERKTLKTE